MARVLLAGSAAADPHLARLLRNEGYEFSAAGTNHELFRAELGNVNAIVYGTRDTNYDFIDKLPGVPVIVLSRLSLIHI